MDAPTVDESLPTHAMQPLPILCESCRVTYPQLPSTPRHTRPQPKAFSSAPPIARYGVPEVFGDVTSTFPIGISSPSRPRSAQARLDSSVDGSASEAGITPSRRDREDVISSTSPEGSGIAQEGLASSIAGLSLSRATTPRSNPEPQGHARSPLDRPSPPTTPSPNNARTIPPFRKIPLLSDEIAINLSDLLQKNLKPDSGSGAIYILEAPIFFSTFPPAQSLDEQWVKIGVAQNVGNRRIDIQNKCGIEDLKAHWVSHWGNMSMDRLDRMEKLCHAQLHNFKRTFTCKHRDEVKEKNHREWFAVDKEVAVRVVKMWKRFMECEPYDECGVLKSVWRDSLRDHRRYRVLEANDASEDQEESLYRSLEGWIEATAAEWRKNQKGTSQGWMGKIFWNNWY